MGSDSAVCEAYTVCVLGGGGGGLLFKERTKITKGPRGARQARGPRTRGL